MRGGPLRNCVEKERWFDGQQNLKGRLRIYGPKCGMCMQYHQNIKTASVSIGEIAFLIHPVHQTVYGEKPKFCTAQVHALKFMADGDKVANGITVSRTAH